MDAYFTYAKRHGLDHDTASVLATMDNAVATIEESDGKTQVNISSNANSSNIDLVSEDRPAPRPRTVITIPPVIHDKDSP